MEGIATFDDWQKVKLIVAEIKNVDEIEGADKLWKLTLNCGELGERTICAGIKPYYSKEELINKKITYFFNLTPRKLKGIESQGMLLAASSADHSKVILISPERDIEPGSLIG
jgi:methionyl-tRNA synthetase